MPNLTPVVLTTVREENVCNPYFVNKTLIADQPVHDLSRSEKMLGSPTSDSISLKDDTQSAAIERSIETKKLVEVYPAEDEKNTLANKSDESVPSGLTARETVNPYHGRRREPHL